MDQDRKFAIRSAFNIVSTGQRRPHSRGHPHRSVYNVTLPSRQLHNEFGEPADVRSRDSLIMYYRPHGASSPSQSRCPLSCTSAARGNKIPSYNRQSE